jgi:serine/threonine protein kinase
VLCDFGSAKSREMKDGSVAKYTPHGTLGKVGYLPEDVFTTLGQEPLDPEKVDVFQLGVCLFIMITKQELPWPDRYPRISFFKHHQGLPDLKSGRIWTETLSAENIPDRDVVDLLKGMLHANPQERFTLEQVLNHSWVSSTNDDNCSKLKSGSSDAN